LECRYHRGLKAIGHVELVMSLDPSDSDWVRIAGHGAFSVDAGLCPNDGESGSGSVPRIPFVFTIQPERYRLDDLVRQGHVKVLVEVAPSNLPSDVVFVPASPVAYFIHLESRGWPRRWLGIDFSIWHEAKQHDDVIGWLKFDPAGFKADSPLWKVW